MKKMKKRNFTEKEWEEMASFLSDENGGENAIAASFSGEEVKELKHVWKSMQGMENDRRIDVDSAWEKVQSRIGSGSSSRAHVSLSIGTVLLRAAAVILVLFAIGSVSLYISSFTGKITVTASADQRNTEAGLPDGSKIFLNHNSSLTYSKRFGKTNRQVKLEGEAFFDIAPDASKPFIIDAGQANIKVVGTSFNVITNNPESAVEVFVKTGKVLMEDKSGSSSISLDPGYIGTMNSGKAAKSLNENPNYLAWYNGKLSYKGEKLSVVFRDLKKLYNIDIVANDPSILDYPWHSDIDYQAQDKIILLICTSFNLSYTKDGNVYHLSEK